MTSRIIGEVNMDFLDATFYKQGIQQSEDWMFVAAHMKEYLKGIVTASNNVSKKGNINNPSELKKIVNTLRDDYEVDGEVSEEDFGEKNLLQRKVKETRSQVSMIPSRISLLKRL